MNKERKLLSVMIAIFILGMALGISLMGWLGC